MNVTKYFWQWLVVVDILILLSFPVTHTHICICLYIWPSFVLVVSSFGITLWNTRVAFTRHVKPLLCSVFISGTVDPTVNNEIASGGLKCNQRQYVDVASLMLLLLFFFDIFPVFTYNRISVIIAGVRFRQRVSHYYWTYRFSTESSRVKTRHPRRIDVKIVSNASARRDDSSVRRNVISDNLLFLVFLNILKQTRPCYTTFQQKNVKKDQTNKRQVAA